MRTTLLFWCNTNLKKKKRKGKCEIVFFDRNDFNFLWKRYKCWNSLSQQNKILQKESSHCTNKTLEFIYEILYYFTRVFEIKKNSNFKILKARISKSYHPFEVLRTLKIWGSSKETLMISISKCGHYILQFVKLDLPSNSSWWTSSFNCEKVGPTYHNF